MGLFGFRCVWEHVRSGDVFIGELWPNREDAEWIADMLRRSESVKNVRVRKFAA